MLTPGRKKNRTKSLLITLAAVIAIVLVFVYFVYFSESGIFVAPGVVIGGKKMPKVETTFEENIFSSVKFNDLKIHGRLPVEVGTKGQINPFRLPVKEVTQ